MQKETSNRCPLFDVVFNKNYSSKACLDHDHSVPLRGRCNTNCGRVRGSICNTSNLLLGRLEKYWWKYGEKHTHLTFSEFLRRSADYLEKDYSENPVHPREVEIWKGRLKKWRKETIVEKLKAEGIDIPRGALKTTIIKLYVDRVIMPKYFEEK